MRLVQVCPWFHPHIGGVESHVKTISAELVRRGHDVTVLTSRYDRRLPEREEMEGYRILRTRTRGVWFRTPITPATKRALATLDVDLVHAHSPPPLTSYYAATAAKRRRLPFVITVHCDLEVPSIGGLLVESLYRSTLGYSTTRRADRIIMSTATYAATSRAAWRYNPVLVPNPIDLRRFHPGVDGRPVRERHGIRADHPVVLFVGRMYGHKGIENLVEAAISVPHAKFLLVGGGPELNALKRLAQRVGVADHTVFTGVVSAEWLPAYFAACDVFVLPSISRLEAFGIVALEAMASGKPVVVSDIPGVREAITNGREGLLADPVNPEDLALKIRTLIADDARRKEMGQKGRETVGANCSVERVTDRIEAIYHDVVRDRAT